MASDSALLLKLPGAEESQEHQENQQQGKAVLWPTSDGDLWRHDHIMSELITAKKGNSQQGLLGLNFKSSAVLLPAGTPKR